MSERKIHKNERKSGTINEKGENVSKDIEIIKRNSGVRKYNNLKFKTQ